MKNLVVYGAMLVIALGCGSGVAPLKTASRAEATVNQPTETPFLAILRQAIIRSDYGELEALRDEDLLTVAEPLISDYHRATEWQTRDAIIFLLQDLKDDRLKPIMQHALDSPTVDTRAIAVCAIHDDNKLFDTFLVNGFVDQGRVDAAIKDFRSSARQSTR